MVVPGETRGEDIGMKAHSGLESIAQIFQFPLVTCQYIIVSLCFPCFPLASSAALSFQLYKCHESVAQQSSLDPLVDVNVVERTRHELEVVVCPDRLL